MTATTAAAKRHRAVPTPALDRSFRWDRSSPDRRAISTTRWLESSPQAKRASYWRSRLRQLFRLRTETALGVRLNELKRLLDLQDARLAVTRIIATLRDSFGAVM